MQFYEFNGAKVTTTSQLADLFQVNKKAITRNYQRNKKRFVEGVHYIRIEGNPLKEFKMMVGNPDYLKFTAVLYLWTVPGIRLIAKSCRSEEAWHLYEQDIQV